MRNRKAEKAEKTTAYSMLGLWRKLALTKVDLLVIDIEGAEMDMFETTPDAVLERGVAIGADHFVAGQKVDVRGVTKGKGFQGPMKRWNFGGQRASHGVSKTHRAHGSMGGCQDPGRVMRGKKMAGRMGGRRRTAQNLVVHAVDADRDLVFVRGAVPGPRGAWVRVSDAVKAVGVDELLGGAVPFPAFRRGEEEAA